MENQFIPPLSQVAAQKKSGSRASRKKKQDQNQPSSKTLEQTLREIFSISQFKPGQQEVIESILNGRDTLAVMPDGAGKSLYHQLPAFSMPGVTLVVSPFISLMTDQSDKLMEQGTAATMRSMKDGDNEFIFVTPERLSDPGFMASVKSQKIDFVVIDEVHCISQRGHDFRPAFLEIGAAINTVHHPVILALTANATEPVIEDIVRQLGIPDMRVINTSIYRPNLQYRVIQTTNEEEKLLETVNLVRDTPGCGIVYAATVRSAEKVYLALLRVGENVSLYHGQLGSRERKHNQEMFVQGNQRVMVATNAFGMGIDKQDIRFVVHYQIPSNLETYYQESGRAGKDGAPAYCTLLYFARDKRVQTLLLARRYPSPAEVVALYATLQSLATSMSHFTFAHIRSALRSISIVKLQVALNLLAEGRFVLQDSRFHFHLLKNDVGRKTLIQLAAKYIDKNKHDREALERLVFYAQTGFCRWKVLLEYFGEKTDWEHCGVCDNCSCSPASMLTPEHAVREKSNVSEKKEDFLLKVGSFVRVRKYGEGHVVSISWEKVTIIFPNSQKKTFLRDYVELI
jgi:ATP-dependent DNA helicase RecQ